MKMSYQFFHPGISAGIFGYCFFVTRLWLKLANNNLVQSSERVTCQ